MHDVTEHVACENDGNTLIVNVPLTWSFIHVRALVIVFVVSTVYVQHVVERKINDSTNKLPIR